MKLQCENCSRTFDSRNALCPDCGWDREERVVEKAHAEALAENEAPAKIAEAPLEDHTVEELRDIAQELEVSKYYELRKDDLIAAIKKAQK